MPQPKKACEHADLVTTGSSNSVKVGYHTYDNQKLCVATTGVQNRLSEIPILARYIGAFPAPLVLPDDELSHDPKYPAQSVRSWAAEPHRNKVTSKRKMIYIAAPPEIGMQAPTETKFWQNPEAELLSYNADLIEPPQAEDLMEYFKSYFHGFPVQMLPDRLEWSTYESRGGSKDRTQADERRPTHVGLTCPSKGFTTRIRVRYANEESMTAYPAQLNLNDVLDQMMVVLPEDAYCIILLTNHDLYEDDDDDFCCGRAYGGSRICVVSTAQYQPALDQLHGVNVKEGHWWPGSHCTEYVEKVCGAATNKSKIIATTKRTQVSNRVSKRIEAQGSDTAMSDGTCEKASSELMNPLKNAVVAQKDLLHNSISTEGLRSLYFRRVALTASHEALHCFGLDHCVYRACVMQATSSLGEDSRQPPYLCVVCEQKLAVAARGVTSNKDLRTDWIASDLVKWKVERHRSILQFCQARGGSDNLGFGAYGVWTNSVLHVLQNS